MAWCLVKAQEQLYLYKNILYISTKFHENPVIGSKVTGETHTRCKYWTTDKPFL